MDPKVRCAAFRTVPPTYPPVDCPPADAPTPAPPTPAPSTPAPPTPAPPTPAPPTSDPPLPPQIMDKRDGYTIMPVPSLQKPAPIFKGTAVVKGMFKDISLEDYKGQYVVIFFYPLDFTFVCPTEIIAFSDRFEEFKKINTAVIACSTDSQFCHLAWVNTPRKEGGLGDMSIPLLADKSCAIARQYGVLDEATGIPFRGLFIIDPKGILRQVTINDLPVGRSVDETLRLVQAFQFTDEHGEVCPAGWTPGQKTMKPDPTGSKDYFASSN